MAQRYFNWKFAVFLLLIIVAVGIAVVSLRQWNRTKRDQAAYQTGLEAFEQGRWNQAATDLGQYIIRNRQDKDILYKYAQAQLNIRPNKIDNVRSAINTYRDILLLDPNEIKASNRLVQIYLAVNEPSEAEDIARKALDLLPDPDIRAYLIQSLHDQGKYQDPKEELQELQDIIKLYPDNILAYQNIVELITDRPDNFPDTSAEFWLNEAVKNNPQLPQVYLNRARFYYTQRKYDLALTDIEQVEQLNPGDINTLLQLASACVIISGDLDQAENYLNQVKLQDSRNVNLWRQKALWARRKDDPSIMTQVAEEGLKELDYQRWDFIPDAIFLNIIAEYLKPTKDFQYLNRAEALIEEIRPEISMIARAEYFSGLIARRRNQIYQAYQHFQKAVESGYTEDFFMSALGYGIIAVHENLVESLFDVGDAQTALSHMRNLSAQYPDNASILLLFSRILNQTNQWQEAAQQAQKAYDLDPGNIEVALFWARTQMQILDEKDTVPWQKVDALLSDLVAKTGGNETIYDLQYQSALRQNQMERARQLIQDHQGVASDLQTKMAEINLQLINGQTEEAVAQLKNCVAQYPEDSLPILNLARVLVSQNQHQEAVDVLRSALGRIETLEIRQNLALELAGLLANQDQIQEAIDVMVPVIENIDEPVVRRDFTLYLSRLYKAMNETDQSYQILVDLASQFPQDVLILRNLVNHPALADNQSQAQKYIDQIKELEGSQGWQWRYEQAQLWYNSENFPDYYTRAVTLLKENLLANSLDQTSRLLLAAIYERRSELIMDKDKEREKREAMRLAIATFLEAYNLTPDNINVISKTLEALYRAGEYDRAAVILNQASRVKLSNPNTEVEFKGRLAWNQLVLGNVDSSISILENVSGNYPEYRQARLLLAAIHIRQGEYDNAENIINELRTEDPAKLDAADWLVNLNLARGTNETALNVCHEMIKTLNTPSAYILRARTYKRLAQPELAEKDYTQALSMDPAKPDFFLERSDFFRDQQKYPEAVADMEKALALDSSNLLFRKLAYQLHIRLMQAGQPNLFIRTRSMLNDDRKKYPNDLELRLYEAQYLLGAPVRLTGLTRSAIEQAKILLQEITQARPDIIEPWLMLSNIALQENQTRAAMDLIAQALVTSPDNIRLLIFQASIQTELEPPEAVVTLENICRRYPDNADYAVLLAHAYIMTNHPDLAIKKLQDILVALEDQTQRRTVNFNLARAKYHNGLKEEALAELDQLFLKQPEDLLVPSAQAELYISDQQWAQLMEKIPHWYETSPRGSELIAAIGSRLAVREETEAKNYALQAYRWLLGQEPENVSILHDYVMILHLQNQKAEVEKLYQKILELDPQNVVALNNYAWILSEEKGDFNTALNFANKGLQLKPDYIDLIDTRGVIYYRLGDMNSAIQDFSRCVELYPRHVPSLSGSYFHLGRAQAEIKNMTEARKNLKNALDLNKKIGGLSPEDEKAAQSLYQKLLQGV